MELNKVINDDCVSFMHYMKKESVDLIIADPPYGIAKKNNLKGTSHGNIQALQEDWDIFSSKEQYLAFTRAWIYEAYNVLKPNGSIMVWGNYKSVFDMKECLEKQDFYFKDMITWVKHDAPPNVTCRLYANSTEFCLWFCKSDSGWTFKHNELKELNEGKQMRNFWDIPRSMTKIEKTPHKTQKKYECCERLVIGHSNVGDLVYIPFAGSGSEIEACIRNNRNWIATEMNNKYIEEIIEPRIKKCNRS